MNTRRILFGVVLLLGSPAGAREDEAEVELKKIGRPVWKPADFHLFSAPIGSAQDGYAASFATGLAILPPPNHQFHPALYVGPGAPHAPPYSSEMALGVEGLGFLEGDEFVPAGFSNGSAVWITFMVLPHPGTRGSSPDFQSGAIIPNTLFPIAFQGVTYHGKTLSDAFLIFGQVPALDGNLDPPFAVDGHSHFPMFIWDSLEFQPPGTDARGEWEYRITMTDKSGNGWEIRARFDVKANHRG